MEFVRGGRTGRVRGRWGRRPRRASRRSRPSRSPYSSQMARQRRHTSCTSGWFQASGLTESRVRASASGSSESGRSGCLNRPAATSMRKPSTPRSSQNRRVRSNSSAISGLRQFQSGCSGVNMCRYHWPSATRVQAGPPNMACQLLGGSLPSGPRPAAKWKRARAGLPGELSRASRNHGCSLEQWLGTMSREHLDAEPPGRRHQLVELVEVAEDRVDVAVVGDVVAVVVLRRGVEGAQPDPVDAELLQVRQPGTDSARSPMPSPVLSRKLRTYTW